MTSFHTSIAIVFLRVYLFPATVFSMSVFRNSSYGDIKGRVEDTVFPERKVETFRGIPFAKPPVGHLRFEPPERPESWHPNVLEALQYSSYCTQSNGDRRYILDISPTLGRKLTSSEDCLYLNIYTPITTSTYLLPVMVYIHGGSNAVGTGAMRDGATLAAFGQIVVVTLNYRLAELGFLGLGEEGFPGNYGLLDQIAALKWVQENIKNFKGDPSKVTAVGHSAGANDVGLHLVSPISKGLFRFAILMSGSPMMPYASTKMEKRLRTRIRESLSTLKCNFKDSLTVKTCLKKVHVDSFLTAANFPCELYSGIIDNYFLSDTGEALLKTVELNAQVVMVGITKDEVNDFTHSVSFKDVVKELVFCGVPRYKSLHYVIQHEYNSEGGHKGKIFSDYLMNSPVKRFADTLVRRNLPVYTYQYDYPSVEDKPSDMAVHRVEVPHGLDVRYIFGKPLEDSELSKKRFTENDKKMSRIMMHIWSSFVKYGYPTFKSELNNMSIIWDKDTAPLYDLHNSSYMRLGGQDSPDVQITRPFLSNKSEFWNQVVPRIIGYIESGVLPEDVSQDLERDYFICRIVAGIFVTTTLILLITLVVLICLIRPKRTNV